MSTVLQARPRRFVSTPSVERVATRALRYLQSGFSVHLRGPAGTGKTTLALHLADLLARPIMLVFGDDEFKTSDLIGNQLGYTRKKVVDNFIHSVVKVEDELKQNWVDSRLTLACREGFTLVYDEFNRSRPEVNNVLLSALEEKILALPPSGNRPEYVRVNPQFRAIFTSNPEEYCGVHSTQDALMDRLVTINMPEPDELTQQEILVQKTEIERESAILITQLVKAFRLKSGAEKSSGLRSGITIAKVCQEHSIPVMAEDADFRDICMDVLLSRTSLPLKESTTLLWELLNELVCREPKVIEPAPTTAPPRAEYADRTVTITATSVAAEPATVPTTMKAAEPQATTEPSAAAIAEADIPDQDQLGLDEAEVYTYLRQASGARVSEIESALSMNRFQAVNALRSLAQKGILAQRNNRLYVTS
ncbi:MAG TPA: gas vesicle protein GvpN [Candidatus Obscuribacterales bacterium]